MALRDRVIKMLGGPSARTVNEITEITSEAMDAQGMIDRPFSPGSPLRPFDGYSRTPRSRDFATGVNISSRPRLNEQVSFSTLRGLVNSYDIAQMCIWHRIDSIRSLDWMLTPKKGHTGDVTDAIEIAEKVLRRPDRESSFKKWLAKYLFDILAYDAGTLYKLRNNGGRVIGLRVLDGTTIAPLLDDWGNRPTGNAPAYVQFAQGIPWEWLADDDIVYEPFRPQSNSMYGKAPLESILLNANTDIRFQQFFLNRFTEGNVPEGFAIAPENWTAEQVSEYQEVWDALLYGDDTRKHQIRWVPGGTKMEWTNEREFQHDFPLFLMRKTAAAYHVTPADLGFTDDVNRASGETQADVQFRVGDLPLLDHINEIITVFLQDDLGLPLEFNFMTGREVEDRIATAQANKIYIETGVVSVSEVREDVFGLSEPGNQAVPRFVMTSRAGPVPLSALEAVAGPVDPDTGAPVPGGPLPHKPFAPIEGVAPQKPADRPPLAVDLYPEENAISAEAAAQADDQPVLKTGAGPGVSVTSGTVAPASPMMADGRPTQTDEERDEEAGTHPADIPEDAKVEKGINSQSGHNASPLLATAATSAKVVVPVRSAHDMDLDESGDNRKKRAQMEDQLRREQGIQKSAEDRAFRTYVKKRLKTGKWSDFTFNYSDEKEARERNRVAKTQVLKSVSVAGLAVRAADTGRVLMLQRGLDPEDPNAGLWEFPGGHLEISDEGAPETPLEAAIREWCEETGCPPAKGNITDEWTSPDGVYQGFVLTVPQESVLDINPDEPFMDNPDGDLVETCAWWDPAQIPGNPAVRPEVSSSDSVRQIFVGPEEVEKSGSAWSQHAFRKIDQALVDHHAPKIQAGMRAMTNRAALRAAVEQYLAQQ